MKKGNTYFSKEDDQDLWKYGNRYNFNLDKIQPHFHEYSRTTLHKRLMMLKKFSNLNSGKIKVFSLLLFIYKYMDRLF